MSSGQSLAPAARVSDMVEVKQPTIAVVDDDAAVRDSLHFLLEVIGHQAATFASAAEFLKAETQWLGCLILDHHMPEMTGLELAERLRTEAPGSRSS